MRYPWSVWMFGEISVGDRNKSVIGIKILVTFRRFDVTPQLEHFGFFPVEREKTRTGERSMDGVETSFTWDPERKVSLQQATQHLPGTLESDRADTELNYPVISGSLLSLWNISCGIQKIFLDLFLVNLEVKRANITQFGNSTRWY